MTVPRPRRERDVEHQTGFLRLDGSGRAPLLEAAETGRRHVFIWLASRSGAQGETEAGDLDSGVISRLSCWRLWELMNCPNRVGGRSRTE